VIYHLVESPTGLVHIAPYRKHTKCGREILDTWSDLGQWSPMKLPPSKIELPMCERCRPPRR
jgi:hypothetical protein